MRSSSVLQSRRQHRCHSVKRALETAEESAGLGHGDKVQGQMVVMGQDQEGGEEGVEGEELQELSQATHIILEDGFKPDTVTALRSVFDARFAGRA